MLLLHDIAICDVDTFNYPVGLYFRKEKK